MAGEWMCLFATATRADPQDDLISELAKVNEGGDTLSDDEMMAMVFLLLVAGHETTVNLIGNGTLALLEHPQEMEKLKTEPALINPAVEEMLRYSSPVGWATERYARQLHEVDQEDYLAMKRKEIARQRVAKAE